jgi:phage terminase Nu1 subunit (DNA packaging protein)
VVNSIDRDATVNAKVERSGKSRAEAEQMVDNWINTYEKARAQAQQTAEEAKQQALQTAEDVSGAISKAASYAFIDLVLGGEAASFGGKLGEPHDLDAKETTTTPVA